MATDDDGIMTIGELAGYLKVLKSMVHGLAQEGELPGQRIGKRRRFHKDAVDAWAKQGLGGPPFNISHRGDERVAGDKCWQYGASPYEEVADTYSPGQVEL